MTAKVSERYSPVASGFDADFVGSRIMDLPCNERPREKLAQLVRGREFEAFDRSLDVQISRLCKMVEVDPATPRYIQTVWGVVYVFVPDATA